MSDIPGGDPGARAEQIESIKHEWAHRQHAYDDGQLRSPETPARWAANALIAWIVAVTAQTAIVALYYLAPDSLPAEFYEWGSAGFNAGFLFDAVVVLAGLAALGLTGWFTYRTMKNLFTVRSPAAAMPPGWTIGWYFIPIASLWQPPMGMYQIYKGSHEMAGRPAPGPSQILIWWISWLLMDIPGTIATYWGSSTVMQLAMFGFGYALGMSAAINLIRIIHSIRDLQSRISVGGVADEFN